MTREKDVSRCSALKLVTVPTPKQADPIWRWLHWAVLCGVVSLRLPISYVFVFVAVYLRNILRDVHLRTSLSDDGSRLHVVGGRNSGRRRKKKRERGTVLAIHGTVRYGTY